LFYDQWQYVLQFKQDHLCVIRGAPSQEVFKKTIAIKKEWQSRRRWQEGAPTFTDQDIDNLQKTNEFLKNTVYPFKLVHSGDYGNLYTNNIELIDQLIVELPHIIINNKVRQAKAVLPKDVVRVRNPLAKYRTYFKERKLDGIKKDILLNWVKSQGHDVIPGPATLNWLKDQNLRWRSGWSRRYFYIEHSNLQYETMISMIIPGIVRKTVPVESIDK
jgi:hypothetical protein